MTPMLFSRFIVNLEQSGSHIPDARSVKLTFSLIVTFHLETAHTCKKNADITKIKEIYFLKEKTYFMHIF